MPSYTGQELPLPAPSLVPETMSAVQRAKASMFTDTAEASYLSTVGQNYGVPRPAITVSDDTYRQLVQLLAWQPKTILFTLYKLMEIIFGSQASLIQQQKRPWRIYEVNPNEIVIELATTLIVQSNTTASYLHGWFGYAQVTGAGQTSFTTTGNVASASAASLVGNNIYAYNGSGWTSTTVTSVSYNATTDVSTVGITAAVFPDGGALFYIDVAGDDSVKSYRGDFLASSGFTSTFTTAAGPATNTIVALGDASLFLNQNHVVALLFNGALTNYTVSSVGAYDPTTNTTSIVMTASTIPGGLTNGAITKTRDVSDTTTTPTHADRVYLSALGAYEIVQYYLDLLVRAAGIVVRLEQI